MAESLNHTRKTKTRNKKTRKITDSSIQVELFGKSKLGDSFKKRPKKTFSVQIKKTPLKPTEVYDTYWKFAAMRQAVFFRKLYGENPPYSDDLVLRNFKFTNAYRASDRVSQYLIRSVIYEGSQDINEIFFRTILFKTFNRIDTWQKLSSTLGTLTWSEYNFELFSSTLDNMLARKERIYSAAYIMASGKSVFGFPRKHRNHLKLIELMISEDLPKRLQSSKSLVEAYHLLRPYPTLGNFLAYQYLIDLNYSPILNFDEDDFVVPGPGARDGIRKCFYETGDYSEVDVIKWMTDQQEYEFDRLGLEFQDLWGRPLKLIDCQNLFCEVDKYARVVHPEIQGISGRTRIKQRYKSVANPLKVWYPPKWKINERIPSNCRSHNP